MAMRKLLTTNNPKTSKETAHRCNVAVQHLAPLRMAGRANVCEWASKGCAAACLNTAGRGGIFKKGETTNIIQEARKARTRFFFDDAPGYMLQLEREISNHVKLSEKHGLTPVVRLNGTSDVEWEHKYLLLSPGTPMERCGNIMERFPDVQFYDYTKSFDRMEAFLSGELPSNYFLAFSRTEDNDAECITLLRRGANVAVVFEEVPETWQGFPVVDGDQHDLIFTHAPGTVLGLKAKGKAGKDDSGFVVRAA